MLATKYDDEALTAILREARGRGQMKDLADRLSKARLSNWFHEGVTADAAFLKLNLPAGGTMLVWFPETRLWLSFVSRLHPKNTDDMILSVLKTHYKTDEQLGHVLQYGLTPNADIAARLKKIVFKYWLREQKSAENVFEFLLKRHRNFVFQTRDLDDWVEYVYMVDMKTPLTTMFKVLDKRFGRDLPNMLDKALKVPRTKKLAEMLVTKL
ncbi:hypothetical protein PHYSODRAFT_339614 [Phytophthora sojae]|uniref:RXLR phytopathogen effector protein WY-domain domain-containing protein n=1 Tax=Phytophthora sojae (strain P6497) TaxID=1094619 RepID=G5A573_PHYSP|nr:hypothetical protein PHYSODRAFT_339614 [Phytophthora sojae]EGZ09258.1 hypothetical protein PHYSODRAFT_339614 [Phytophthora sojae]|eukprot:XP_009535891.1 hypothetical protein PHYSODRAFT_339614 [Phytophthora sojae]